MMTLLEILIGVILLPFLTYFVIKFGRVGWLSAEKIYKEINPKNK